MDKEIFVERAVVDSILSYAQMLHPREAILLLKGKVDKHKIVINDTQIPPLATHGITFPVFPYIRFQSISQSWELPIPTHQALCVPQLQT